MEFILLNFYPRLSFSRALPTTSIRVRGDWMGFLWQKRTSRWGRVFDTLGVRCDLQMNIGQCILNFKSCIFEYFERPGRPIFRFGNQDISLTLFQKDRLCTIFSSDLGEEFKAKAKIAAKFGKKGPENHKNCRNSGKNCWNVHKNHLKYKILILDPLFKQAYLLDWWMSF